MPKTPRTYPGRSNAKTGGFTLIELLAVMMILGILMVLVVGVARQIFSNTQAEETRNSMNIIMSAVTAYNQVRVEKGYPVLTKANYVSALASRPESKKLIGTLGEKVWSANDNKHFRDGWGKPIEYTPTGGLAGAPGLISGGPDGATDTKDDNVRYNR